MIKDVLTRGRTAVITGGASGIGLAAADKFAQMGMNIAIADTNKENIDAATTALKRTEVEIMGMEVDVADFSAVCDFRDQVLHQFGDVAILMNNAVLVLEVVHLKT